MPQEDITTNEMIRPDASAKRVGFLYEMAEVLSSAVLCIAVLFTFMLRFAGVDGNSMTPTLQNGEWLAITAIRPQPARSDIVIISPRNGHHKPLVKRVIGVAGDEIDLVDGHVLLNGTPMEEPYLPEETLTYPAPEHESDLTYPVRVPAGRVFVMGDNRGGSSDSRRNQVGFVRVDDILGKVLFRMKPFFVTQPLFEFTYKVK